MRFIPWASLAAIAALAAGSAQAGEKVAHSFCKQATLQCPDGMGPQSTLLRDGDGNFYGTAGGGVNAQGIAFALSPKAGGKWSYRVLYNFCNLANCADGGAPQGGPLVIDTGGRLYGVAAGGPSNNRGVVFRLTPQASGKPWTIEILHAFCASSDNCRDGADPGGGLTMPANLRALLTTGPRRFTA